MPDRVLPECSTIEEEKGVICGDVDATGRPEDHRGHQESRAATKVSSGYICGRNKTRLRKVTSPHQWTLKPNSDSGRIFTMEPLSSLSSLISVPLTDQA